MARRPRVVRDLSRLRKAVAEYGAANETLALVPTMGALHAGHLALVRLAKKRADRVAVSIFVNPTQFAPSEDFSSYPRTFDADVTALVAHAVDIVWAPAAETMYPEGFVTRIAPEGPAKAGLEDAARPHFFGGVATVVAKLFLQATPDIAIFGEKDYQQLKVVTRMARDLDIPTKVVGAPTVREKDGLAMSSRNAYLEPSERALAPMLYRMLNECASRMKAGEHFGAILEQGRAAIRQAGFKLDYLEARHAETLVSAANLADGPVRLLVAARIGKTRLIDNIGV